MKRLLTALTVLLVLVPTLCSAEGYVMVNYGIGGDIDEPSLGVEMGGIFLSRLHPEGGAVSFGLGVSVADTDEDIPATVFSPPAGFDQFIEYNDGNEQEVYVSFGAEIIPALFAVTGMGYASQDTVTIGRFGGQNFEVDSESDNNISWMLGLRYVIQGLNAGVGFHSRRGVMVGLGVAF